MEVGALGQDGGVGALGWNIRQWMEFQTRDGVLDWGWGSRQGIGFQTWGWGSRHGMMGYQTDDGVPARGGVTTFTSHHSGILHSLIFFLMLVLTLVYKFQIFLITKITFNRSEKLHFS